MTSPQIITATNKRVMSLSDHYRQTLNGMIPPPKGSFYQGGYYITDITYADGRKFGLILSPQSGGYIISYWSSAGGYYPASTSEDDGFENSEKMNNTKYGAAYFCRSLSIGGYTDWYLPSNNELIKIYDFRSNIPSGQEFITHVDYGLLYWTSCSYAINKSFAERVDFYPGASNRLQALNITNPNQCRAIRRFSLN